MSRALVWLTLALSAQAFGATTLRFRTVEIPTAVVGQPYSAHLEVAGNAPCALSDSWLTTEDPLPPGLELTADGFEGLPRQAGTYSIVVSAHNRCGKAAKSFKVVVAPKPLLMAEPAEVYFAIKGTTGTPASQTVLVSSDWQSLPYELYSEKLPWLRIRGGNGVTPGGQSPLRGDVLSITVERANLAPGVYVADLKVRAWQASNQPVIRITVVVEDQITLPRDFPHPLAPVIDSLQP